MYTGNFNYGLARYIPQKKQRLDRFTRRNVIDRNLVGFINNYLNISVENFCENIILSNRSVDDVRQQNDVKIGVIHYSNFKTATMGSCRF